MDGSATRFATRRESSTCSPAARSHTPATSATATGRTGPGLSPNACPAKRCTTRGRRRTHTMRRAMIESLGPTLRALHQVSAPAGLLPPWLADALAGQPRMAYHPPVVDAALHEVDAARRQPRHDSRLLADVTDWIQQRLQLFAADEPVLVHGDL